MHVPSGGAPAPFSLIVRVRDWDAFDPDTGDFEVFSGNYTLVLATDATAAADEGAMPAETQLLAGRAEAAIATFHVRVSGTYNWTWDFTQG